MDWLGGLQKGLEAARQQAADASVRARELANQASVQARLYAEQATAKAKVLAEETHAKIAEMQEAHAAQGVTQAEDPAAYGVTDALVDAVSTMTYSTFSDSPAGGAPAPSSDFRLSPWQEKHAVMVLARAEQLQHLRFALCPKRMGEQQFWTVYFSLVRDFLPQPHGNAPAPASASPAVQKLPLGALQGGRDAPAAALSGAAIGTEAAASVVGGAGAAELTAVSGDEASRGSEGAAAGEDDSSGSGDGDEDDGVASLDDDDPELAEYLQDALAVDEDGDDGVASDDLGSLDGYLHQLGEEDDDDEKADEQKVEDKADEGL